MCASNKETKNKITANPKESTQWSFVVQPSHFKPFTKLPQGITCAAVATVCDATNNEHMQGFIKTVNPICSNNLRSLIGQAIFRMVKSIPDILIDILMRGASEHGCSPSKHQKFCATVLSFHAECNEEEEFDHFKTAHSGLFKACPLHMIQMLNETDKNPCILKPVDVFALKHDLSPEEQKSLHCQ